MKTTQLQDRRQDIVAENRKKLQSKQKPILQNSILRDRIQNKMGQGQKTI